VNYLCIEIEVLNFEAISILVKSVRMEKNHCGFLQLYVLQTVTSWFDEFNDEQKNLLLTQLLVCGQSVHAICT